MKQSKRKRIPVPWDKLMSLDPDFHKKFQKNDKSYGPAWLRRRNAKKE